MMMVPGLAQAWPTHVAPEGCRFFWEGTGGYREIATSHGPEEFPLILFSRDDWGPGAHPFVPFCGIDCLSAEGAAAMMSLWPLEVGKAARIAVEDNVLTMRVAARGAVAPLEVDAFHIVTTVPGEDEFHSWWSVELGWIVRYSQDGFDKVVVAHDCPNPSS